MAFQCLCGLTHLTLYVIWTLWVQKFTFSLSNSSLSFLEMRAVNPLEGHFSASTVHCPLCGECFLWSTSCIIIASCGVCIVSHSIFSVTTWSFRALSNMHPFVLLDQWEWGSCWPPRLMGALIFVIPISEFCYLLEPPDYSSSTPDAHTQAVQWEFQGWTAVALTGATCSDRGVCHVCCLLRRSHSCAQEAGLW